MNIVTPETDTADHSCSSGVLAFFNCIL